MFQTPLVRGAAARAAPRACPTCHRFLTAKLVCWGCFDRLCRLCGHPTGSALIETCWPCSYREDADREAGKDPLPETAATAS